MKKYYKVFFTGNPANLDVADVYGLIIDGSTIDIPSSATFESILEGLLLNIKTNISNLDASIADSTLVLYGNISTISTINTGDSTDPQINIIECALPWESLTEEYIDSISTGNDSRYKNIRDLIGRPCYINPHNTNELHIYRTSSGDFTIISIYSIVFDSNRTFVYLGERALFEISVPYCSVPF